MSSHESRAAVIKRVLRRVSMPDHMPFLVLTGIIMALLSTIHVLLAASAWGVFGFSFDDSWIHVQYARTIFEGRAWEYAVGIPSTGSSAPLWSVVLTPIFLLGYGKETVVSSVLVISAVLYVVDAFLVGILVEERTGRWQLAVLGQIVFVLVPRNAGLMLSGMETPLAMMMVLLALILLPKRDVKYDLLLGVVAGLSYLCRPEFVLIAAICLPVRAAWLLITEKLSMKRIGSVVCMFGLAALVVAPWVMYCLSTTGLPLADSYYSKLRWGVTQDAIDLWDYFWYSAWFPAEPYLSLGFAGGIALAAKGRPFETLMTTSLFVLFRLTMPSTSLLFAARYLVPLFDLLAISFVAGCFIIIETLFAHIDASRYMPTDRAIVAAAFISILFVPSLSSYVLHVDIHANQIKNINEMQVTLSEWARNNVPEDAVIATYDVGALGYFSECTVIDIYGLVTPAMLHDCVNLHEQAVFLKELDCDYVMFYEEWFIYLWMQIASIGGNATKILSVHIDMNVVCGTSNMAIYRVLWQ